MSSVDLGQRDGLSCGGGTRRRSLRSFAAVVSVGLCVAACGSTSHTASGTDGGKGGSDAGAEGPFGLGFYPSNIACGLSASDIASVLASLDITAADLGDVDITKADAPSLASDTYVCAGTGSCNSRFAFKSSAKSDLFYTTVTQSDGSKVGVYVANSWTIEAGATLSLYGKYPIALVAITDFTVDGTIDATGETPALGQTPPGGYPATSSMSVGAAGLGPGGGPGGSTSGDGVGGGGAGFCGKGGPGGGGSATGATYGTSDLVPIVGGSSGGIQYGGEGGGAVEIVAGGQITVSGVVTAGGAGGNVGQGGGGSGGALLLEAPVVNVTGTLAANGGGGGSSGDANGGSSGLASAKPAPGGTNPNGAAGGEGSAGTTTAGGAGASAMKTVGGGGGGAGYIRINTTAGSAKVSGTLSPASSTSCVSEGKVASVAPSCK